MPLTLDQIKAAIIEHRSRKYRITETAEAYLSFNNVATLTMTALEIVGNTCAKPPFVESEAAFYMVYSPQGRAPTFRHPTEAAARAEADRLARTLPGQEFYVLRAIAKKQHKAVETVELA